MAGSTGRQGITTARWSMTRAGCWRSGGSARPRPVWASCWRCWRRPGTVQRTRSRSRSKPRGLLVAALRAAGRPVYPINPLAVARYRERTSVSGKKSDHLDAMALANILRTDAHLHRMLPEDSDLARSVSVLARAHQDAVWRRT